MVSIDCWEQASQLNTQPIDSRFFWSRASMSFLNFLLATLGSPQLRQLSPTKTQSWLILHWAWVALIINFGRQDSAIENVGIKENKYKKILAFMSIIIPEKYPSTLIGWLINNYSLHFNLCFEPILWSTRQWKSQGLPQVADDSFARRIKSKPMRSTSPVEVKG